MKTHAQPKKDVQAERVAAQGASWSAPGINRVDNELRVSP